jgi:hypothetical protein
VLGLAAGSALVELLARAVDLRVPADPFIHFGRVAPFFTERTIDGVSHYRVVHRDFYRERNLEFPRAKPRGGFRIFCIGGSASAGWPPSSRRDLQRVPPAGPGPRVP